MKYYLKRHIINTLNKQIVLNVPLNDNSIKNLLKQNIIVNKIEDQYSEEIKKLLIENFETYLYDYYSDFYTRSIIRYHNHFIFL